MLESVESCCINHGKFSEFAACSNSHGLAYIHGSPIQFFCASCNNKDLFFADKTVHLYCTHECIFGDVLSLLMHSLDLIKLCCNFCRWFLSYSLCDACGRLFTRGKYCPICLKARIFTVSSFLRCGTLVS